MRSATVLASLFPLAGGLCRGGGQPLRFADRVRRRSQPAAKGPAEYFTGNVRVDPLFGAKDTAPFSGSYVTFEPGARSAWHTHRAGQHLIVTAGVGWTQEWGGPVVELRPGDVVWCPPGIKHWHGATPTTAMTHIALTGMAAGKNVAWLEEGQRRAIQETLGCWHDGGRHPLANWLARGRVIARARSIASIWRGGKHDEDPSDVRWQGGRGNLVGQRNSPGPSFLASDDPHSRGLHSTEKIGYPPRKLSTADAPAGVDPSVGDIAYYAPWGNLAIFYKDFGYSRGLVKLGRLDSSIETVERVRK